MVPVPRVHKTLQFTEGDRHRFRNGSESEPVPSSPPLWDAWRDELTDLSAYGVSFRYPGEFADKKEAREAVATCKKVRDEVRRSLGLEPSGKPSPAFGKRGTA